MKTIVRLAMALAVSVALVGAALAQAELFCYACPDGSDVARAEDGNYYCLTPTGAYAGVPLWAKPHTAIVVWALPSPGAACPVAYERVEVDGAEWCASCPADYERRGAFCYQCIRGYRLIGVVVETERPACTALGAWDWHQLDDRRGHVEQVQDGLLLIGDDWTNGSVRNGYLDGNGVESARTFDLSGGGQIRVRFSVNGRGRYMAVTSWLAASMTPRHLSTHNTWAGSVLVPEGIWLYAEATIHADGSYLVTLSDAGYDGTPIVSSQGRMTETGVQLRFEFSDNYAGPSAAAIVSDAVVCPNW